MVLISIDNCHCHKTGKIEVNLNQSSFLTVKTHYFKEVIHFNYKLFISHFHASGFSSLHSIIYDITSFFKGEYNLSFLLIVKKKTINKNKMKGYCNILYNIHK